MNFKRLTAHVTAIAIGCASTAILADANYTQRAKEQAERAAAAAAIAAEQVEAARVATPEVPSQGAETNLAPADNNPKAQTSTSSRSSTPAQTAQTEPLKTVPVFRTFSIAGLHFLDSMAFLNMSLAQLSKDLRLAANVEYKILDQLS